MIHITSLKRKEGGEGKRRIKDGKEEEKEKGEREEEKGKRRKSGSRSALYNQNSREILEKEKKEMIERKSRGERETDRRRQGEEKDCNDNISPHMPYNQIQQLLETIQAVINMY